MSVSSAILQHLREGLTFFKKAFSSEERGLTFDLASSTGRRAFQSVCDDAAAPGITIQDRALTAHVTKDVTAANIEGKEDYAEPKPCVAGHLYWRIKSAIFGLPMEPVSLRSFGPRLDFWPFFTQRQLVVESAAFLLRGLAILCPFILSCDGDNVATFFEQGLAARLFKSTHAFSDYLSHGAQDRQTLQGYLNPALQGLTWRQLVSGDHLARVGQVSIVPTGPNPWNLAFAIRNIHTGFLSRKPALLQASLDVLALIFALEGVLAKVVLNQVASQGSPQTDNTARAWFEKAFASFQHQVEDSELGADLKAARARLVALSSLMNVLERVSTVSSDRAVFLGAAVKLKKDQRQKLLADPSPNQSLPEHVLHQLPSAGLSESPRFRQCVEYLDEQLAAEAAGQTGIVVPCPVGMQPSQPAFVEWFITRKEGASIVNAAAQYGQAKDQSRRWITARDALLSADGLEVSLSQQYKNGGVGVALPRFDKEDHVLRTKPGTEAHRVLLRAYKDDHYVSAHLVFVDSDLGPFRQWAVTFVDRGLDFPENYCFITSVQGGGAQWSDSSQATADKVARRAEFVFSEAAE